MTVTIGMIRRDSVLLAADSAVTHDGPAWTERSTLGEPTWVAGQVVEERAAKIVELGPFAAATMTGDEHGATEFLRWLRPHVGEEDAAEMVRSTHAALRPLECFEIVLGRYHKGDPELLWYRSFTGRVIRLPAVVTGSLPDEQKVQMDTLARAFGAQGWPPEEGAVGLVAALIRNGLYEAPAFAHGVGGAYHALIVGPSGVSWMPDTRLVTIPPHLPRVAKMSPDPMSVYGQELAGLHWIAVVTRGGVVTVGSSIVGQARVLSNDFIRSGLKEWQEQWGPEVLHAIRDGAPRFVALISMHPERIIVLDLQAGGDALLKITATGQALRDDLVSALFAPVAEGRREVRLVPERALVPTARLLAADSTSRGDARDLADRALQAHSEGRGDDVEACLVRALSVASDDLWVAACATFLFASRGDQPALKEALVAAVKNIRAVDELVTGLVGIEGDPFRAEVFMRLLLEARPADPEILGSLAGLVAARNGSPDESDKLWTAAHAVAPEHGMNLARHAVFVAETLNDLDRARSLIERIPASDPRRIDGTIHLATMFWKAGRRTEALALWEDSFKRRPASAETAGGTGFALWALGQDVDRAGLLLAEAASLDTMVTYEVNLVRFQLCAGDPGARVRLQKLLGRSDLPPAVTLELRFCEVAHFGCTPARLEGIRTLLQQGVRVPGGELWLHLADSGADSEYLSSLADVIEGKRRSDAAS